MLKFLIEDKHDILGKLCFVLLMLLFVIAWVAFVPPVR